MPVAGSKKYHVSTGAQPEVTISVHFTQKGEKFFVPISDEHYARLSDQERVDLGVKTNLVNGYAHVIAAERFKDAYEGYQKLLEVVHDTVEGIEAVPMIRVKFGAYVREAREMKYAKDGERERKEILAVGRSGWGNDLIKMELDFHRVWVIKTDKREGVLEKPLEDSKPEDIRYALNNGFRGDGLGSDGKTFYLPWDQNTWDALLELHGHMHRLLSNLDDLLSGDLATKLIAASKAGKLLGNNKTK